MKINNLGYLLADGFRGIFRHGFMSFAAVCVTVACLLIVGSFSILVYNVNIMVEELNKTNEVIAYIDDTYEEHEAQDVHTQINDLTVVRKATFVTREQALEKFIVEQGAGEAFAGMTPDYLRHRCVIVLQDNEDIEKAVEQIGQIEGVADIRADYELAKGFSTIQNVLHVASITVITVLLIVSLLIISNTVKLAMYDRREEISIMKMVGATNGFIRLPFVVEGFTLGMTGAAVAFGLEWLMYDALLKNIATMDDALHLFQFVPFSELLVPMIVTFAAAGLFVGVLGSWTSIRKFMDV